jgi:hypothetical protein
MLDSRDFHGALGHRGGHLRVSHGGRISSDFVGLRQVCSPKDDSVVCRSRPEPEADTLPGVKAQAFGMNFRAQRALPEHVVAARA